MWKHLDDYQIILGSQSPRRVELLRGLDLPFEQIRLEGVDESYPTDPVSYTHLTLPTTPYV